MNRIRLFKSTTPLVLDSCLGSLEADLLLTAYYKRRTLALTGPHVGLKTKLCACVLSNRRRAGFSSFDLLNMLHFDMQNLSFLDTPGPVSR